MVRKPTFTAMEAAVTRQGKGMKLSRVAAIAALALFVLAGARARADSSDIGEPVALGVDVGTAAISSLMGAPAGGLSLDLPLGHPLSLTLQTVASWTPGTGSSVFQLALIAQARFYFVSLFVPETGQADWGPFIAAGAAVAWTRELNDSTVDAVSFGPDVQAGYRLVFGDRGIFLEPTFAWLALYGARFDVEGPSPVTSSAYSAGLTVGYRF